MQNEWKAKYYHSPFVVFQHGDSLVRLSLSISFIDDYFFFSFFKLKMSTNCHYFIVFVSFIDDHLVFYLFIIDEYKIVIILL